MKRDRYFGVSPRIARWKINTPLERFIGHRADKSESWKKIYVFYYKLFDNKYYRGGISMIKGLIETRQEDFRDYNTKYIIRDMIYSLHRFGFSFQDYCIYGFVRLTPRSRRTFVADKLRYHYCDILNKKEIEHLMTDKYACYNAYKRFYKREMIGCYNAKDKKTFIDFVSRHERFIFKPMNEHSGHGIKILNSTQINSDLFFDESISKGEFVVEELIQQGKELSLIHPYSINSLRVVTFVINRNVKIIGATLRMGCGEAFTDNAGSGGIYASVDFQHGIIQTDAVNYKGEHFNFHPTTDVQIIGLKLPKWLEALDLIEKITTNVEGTTLISWDIAYSNNGWVMVEANDNGDWSILQSNKKEGLKSVLYSSMDEYFNV